MLTGSSRRLTGGILTFMDNSWLFLVSNGSWLESELLIGEFGTRFAICRMTDVKPVCMFEGIVRD
jgi:hypothetical protein